MRKESVICKRYVSISSIWSQGSNWIMIKSIFLIDLSSVQILQDPFWIFIYFLILSEYTLIGSNSFSNVYKWGWTRPWQVCQGQKLVSTFQFGSGLTTKSWLHCTTYLVLFQFYSANQIACQTGLGTLLYHTQVSWIVLSLMHSENSYITHKLQFPTLKCANSTQQQPFTHVFNTADLDVTGHRWISSLASFKFNILFRSGNRKNNDDENSLSR